jgi:hypothetical protein
MLKLNASYSKKVPSDAKFSSESYLACIEVELPTGMTTSELQNKIHNTFDLVKQSVENEIASRTAKDVPAKQQRPQGRPEAPATTTTAATNKQIGFILKLGKERQKGLPELNDMAHSLFKAESIYQLTKGDASKLVDQLKLAAYPSKQHPNTPNLTPIVFKISYRSLCGSSPYASRDRYAGQPHRNYHNAHKAFCSSRP